MKRLLLFLHLAVAFLVVPCVLFGQATSTWVFTGSDGHLHYKTDANGNRILDYSYAGYEGGGMKLPVVPVVQTISPVSGDNTAHIQAAINAVSALTPDANGFRGAVLLQAGTYNVSGTISITAGGVVLRGSGSGTGGSNLNMTGSPHLLLSISGSGSATTVGSSASITDSFVPSGALSFNVNSTSGFNVGDTILVQRPVTAPWVHFMNMDTLTRNGAHQTWISVGSIIHTDRTIAAINGNQITLDAPITDSFDSSLLNPPAGSIIKYTFAGRIAQVGVEHLSVTAPAADVDISMPQFQALSMNTVINGWVQDLIVHDTDNSISIGGGTKQITLDNVTITHSLAFTHSAGPADFGISGTRILLNKCSSKGNTGVWAYVVQAEVTGPVVLLNSNSDSRGFAPHQRWATGILADSSQFPGGTSGTPGIAFSDRGNFGSGQGWDAGWAVAWNVTSPDFLVQEPPGVNNWCIGCVGTEVTTGAPGGPSTLPNGIYESLGTHVTPSSLYLAQLCDRLGAAAAANIGYSGACGSVIPPDFSLSAAPASQTVTAGGSTSYTATVTPSNGFNGTVSLGVSGLPSGASCSPASISGGSGSAAVNCSTAISTAAGTYTLGITGTSGSLSHSATVTLGVNAPPPPDFSLSASPSSQTVTAGGGTSYTATVAPSNGFSGTVSLAVGGLPSGVTCSAPSISGGSGSSTVSCSTTSSTTPATYTLTITGTSGSLSHSTTVTLVVSAAVTTTKYEAEASGNTLSGAVAVAACAGCSGGQRVRFIGSNTSNFLVINNITVSTAGTYTLTIFPVVSGTRTLFYSVNGGTGSSVSATGTSWTATAPGIAVKVTLNAGSNNVKFYNNTAFGPDMDYITVGP
ncbi:MAG TPA: hypothetical protein VK738_04125 [Terriglobales bacterium]|nr:hypothetical protein [Terriglobales bacterium]